MQRGPKPKPIAQLKVQGTYDASRHRRRERAPVAEGDLADVAPPVWLSTQQKRAWRQAIQDAAKGVLKRADRQLFLAYIVAAARFEVALRKQNELDASVGAVPLLTRSVAGALTVSPYVRMMNQASAVIVQLGAELGFSPSARTRLGQPAGPISDDDSSTWAALKQFPTRVIEGGLGPRKGSAKKA
jgi:P27 family predicted phage terminase small subunit